jgi:hypothetical protein
MRRIVKEMKKIMRELQIPHVTEFIEQCRKICKEHIDMMSSDIPKRILKYQPKLKEVWEDLCNDGQILFANICNRT